MTVLKHEMKQSRFALLIWTVSVAFLLVICIFMFPEMKAEMAGVTRIFASMGSFTEAFGMDRLNFGEFLGFYGIECGNILGLGGAFFAAFMAAPMLSKEEKDHTAEFLLTHPVSRVRIITEKLCAVLVQLLVMNGIVLVLSVGSTVIIGEKIDWEKLYLLHLAYFLVQIEIAAICFAISAFTRSSSLGAGLGIAILMYFLNLIANMADSARFLKYITPFAYAEGADIIAGDGLDGKLLLLGAVYTAVSIAAAYWKYTKKDIS